jgi:hypothetical protein
MIYHRDHPVNPHPTQRWLPGAIRALARLGPAIACRADRDVVSLCWRLRIVAARAGVASLRGAVDGIEVQYRRGSYVQSRLCAEDALIRSASIAVWLARHGTDEREFDPRGLVVDDVA